MCAVVSKVGMIISSIVLAANYPLPALGAEAIERISVTSSEAQANGASIQQVVSPNGRYVVFSSQATNLVSGDSNGWNDLFIRDRQAGTTKRVSLTTSGGQANGRSDDPSMSANARYIAFDSGASNLVPGLVVPSGDVFVRDRTANTTQLISVATTGSDGNNTSLLPSISSDGRYVAFESRASNLIASDTNGNGDIFVRDRQAGTTQLVSVGPGGIQGNNYSADPSISGTGRYVAFESQAFNLVAGGTTKYHVFVRDRQAGTTQLVSRGTGGAEGNNTSLNPAISANGRYVAFESVATNLVAGDTNLRSDIFLRDLQTGTTSRISVGPGGVQANEGSFHPAFSPDNRYVAFDSAASNLVTGDTNARIDVFVRDLQTGTTRLASRGIGNVPASGSEPSVATGASVITFHTAGSNLVAGDTNSAEDVFARIITP